MVVWTKKKIFFVKSVYIFFVYYYFDPKSIIVHIKYVFDHLILNILFSYFVLEFIRKSLL